MSKIVIGMVDQKKVFHELANRFIGIRWNISDKYLYQIIELSGK